MINIKELKPEDNGRWVEYTGGAGEQERGRIKSWNDQYVFVVYKCNGEWERFREFTGQATSPGDLKFLDSTTCDRCSLERPRDEMQRKYVEDEIFDICEGCINE